MFSYLSLRSKSAKAFCFILFIFVLTFCDDDETYINSDSTNFTFYVIEEARAESRFSGKSIPAYVIVSIDGWDKKSVVADKKLTVHWTGEQFISDDPELSPGHYTLTKFVVLDSAYKAVYAAPKEDSELAQFASVRLPLGFSVQENTETSVTAQVLAVSDNSPSQFGYQHLDFDIGNPPASALINLPVKLLLAQNDSPSYDSVFIRFFNPDKILLREQRLTLDAITNVATGTVRDLSSGVWIVEIEYFRTLTARRESGVLTGTGTITLTSSATELLSDGYTLFVIDSADAHPSEVVMRKDQYYFFYFFDNESLNATVTLPVDPLNPQFEISLINSRWDYFYADRTFYDTRPNEPGSNYLQGTAAFEKYNESSEPIDYQDTTSFKMLTNSMQNRDWDLADCLVIFYIDGVEQPILYHQWHNKIPIAGRKITNISRDEIQARQRANLGPDPARVFQREDVLPGD